jgi:hypothetical protein
MGKGLELPPARRMRFSDRHIRAEDYPHFPPAARATSHHHDQRYLTTHPINHDPLSRSRIIQCEYPMTLYIVKSHGPRVSHVPGLVHTLPSSAFFNDLTLNQNQANDMTLMNKPQPNQPLAQRHRRIIASNGQSSTRGD